MNPEDARNLMPVAERPPLVMDRGEGSLLWDESGKRYLDFVQGWAVNTLGHASPVLRAALDAQAAQLVSPSPAFFNRPALELSRAIAAHGGLDHVFFCNSGAEANEGAIKLVRKWGRIHRDGAFEIVTTEHGFHGRTLATMAASGKPGWDALFPPRVEGFVKVPYGDAAAVERAITDRTVAVLVEPIQGEAGVVVPPDGYLRDLRGVCERHGLLLVLDEVQTGMGRTGTLFAWEHEGVRPDVMTLGKGLGGGVPIAALCASEQASCFAPGDQGGTFNGNPLATAAGLAVLQAVTAEGFLAGVRERGSDLQRGLQDLSARGGGAEVRGRGLLWALRLQEGRAEAVRDQALERGLLVNAPRPDVLRFMPALTVTKAEVAEMLGLLGAVLQG